MLGGTRMKYASEKMTMSDGNVNVVHHWLPDGEVNAVVVLSHGMAEHAARYERFGSLLSEKGIALYAEDHRGHGETAKLAEENGSGKFGYLADKDGFFRVADDIHEEILNARKLYPGKKVFLFGHSFGSFISQCVIEKYGSDLDGVILCGTAGPQKALVGAGKCVGNLVKLFKGKKNISKFIDSMAFGAYNKKIENLRTTYDWLSRDNEQVDKYIADPWCGFTCTVGFFCDMFAGFTYIHNDAHIKQIPNSLPVLFIDGTGDPVGSYGATVQNLHDIYKANGVNDLEIKLYENARHELLNETNKEEVESDVIAWLTSHI
jgi:alpha-beta hydrolase superfamily lysophospholipase